MPQKFIDNTPINSGTGDSLYEAFEKTNDNFTELYAKVTSFDGNIANGVVTGTFTVSGELNASGNTNVRDTKFQILNNTNTSKVVKFSLAGHPSSSISTLVLPSGNDTILAANSIATLTSKTIDGAYNSFANIRLSNTIGTLSTTNGGTGVSGIPAFGEILIGNGVGFALSQITPGDGVEIDNSTPGRITISATSLLDPSQVQDIVGQMFVDNQSEGIAETFDPSNRKVNLFANDWAIDLVGDVEGHAVVSRLSDTVITTVAPNLLKGITTRWNTYPTGPEQSVRQLNFVGPVELSQDGDQTTVIISTQLTTPDVRDIIGNTIIGSMPESEVGTDTDSGIIVIYDKPNNSLKLAPREFNVNVTGVVSGSGVSSRLRDIVIETTSDRLIEGLTVTTSNLSLGDPQTVKSIDFSGNLIVAQDGNHLTVYAPPTLTNQDVREVVGTTIQGSTPDEVTGFPTDSGIIVNYVAEDQTLQLGVRPFNIKLEGDISGSGTVKRLQDVVINTSATTLIKGIAVKKDDVLVGYENSIKSLNFSGVADLTVDNAGQATVSIGALSSGQVAPIVGGMLTGDQFGINATYDANNRNIDFALKPIKINLAGAVVGTGNVTFTGSPNDGTVTINTVGGTGGAGGVTIADEYNVTGTVNEINFVGGGITTAVSIDGTTATVYVPNSPAAENFILATDGSENVQNARRFSAGTGISIVDEGPGGRFIVSAASDALLAKSQIFVQGEEIGQEFGIDFHGSQEIVVQAVDQPESNRVKLTIYSLEDGWYRKLQYDCGVVTDKYGSTLDMGDFTNKIINYAADLGTLQG